MKNAIVSFGFLACSAILQANECVSLSVVTTSSVNAVVLQKAKETVKRIFHDIDIPVRWTDDAECSSIRLLLDSTVPGGLKPDVMAYAHPYQEGGTQIRIFLPRVLHCPNYIQNATLLGYVIAHEAAHVLEGVSRHSASGVMKPHWDATDYPDMFSVKFGFAREDVLLMRAGMAKKMYHRL